MHGEGEELLADMGDRVTLDAGTFKANRVVLTGDGINEAYISASKEFVNKTTSSGKIKNVTEIKNAPEVAKEKVTSEGVKTEKAPTTNKE